LILLFAAQLECGLSLPASHAAHYREMASQFRGWAENEQNAEARAGLLDMARQYDRLALEVGARIDPILAKRD
jgi:hypothetical protein